MANITAKFIITGVDQNADSNFLNDLNETLNDRPHLLSPSVTKSGNDYNVEITMAANDPTKAIKAMHEELFEIMSAICNKIEGVKVTHLD